MRITLKELASFAKEEPCKVVGAITLLRYETFEPFPRNKRASGDLVPEKVAMSHAVLGQLITVSSDEYVLAHVRTWSHMVSYGSLRWPPEIKDTQELHIERARGWKPLNGVAHINPHPCDKWVAQGLRTADKAALHHKLFPVFERHLLRLMTLVCNERCQARQLSLPF